ncbi:class I SAM-dependent DNA methyltransferase, partial [bacterium]|nr:class I SAM-dependent DNA methyltransferase [bacterium]
KKGNKLNLKYIIALLNSVLMNFYFNKKMITNPDIFPYIKGIHLKKLPIKKISKSAQKPFIEIVDKILDITKNSDYLENPTKKEEVKEYERQIDQRVYKLYGLTDDEIKIAEEG